MTLVFTAFLYIISGLYLSILTAAFFGTLGKKPEHGARKTFSQKPSVSVVILIRRAEDLKIENIIKILDQDYDGPVEYIILDQTGRYENKNGQASIFYQKKILSFHVRTLNWPTITEILTLKASGEKVLFIHGRSRIGRSWISAFIRELAENGSLVIARTIIDTDTPRPRYVQAIDQLYRITLAKGFSRHGYLPFISLNNIGFSRESALRPAESYTAWLTDLLHGEASTLRCATETDTGCVNDPAERFLDFLVTRRQECEWTHAVFLKTMPGMVFLGTQLLMNISPMIYFFYYLAGASHIYPLVIALFAKFIGEGLIVSRGAKLHTQQDLLNDFWSWFIANPMYNIMMSIWIILPGRRTQDL